MNAQPAPRGIQNWQVAEENAATWMRHWGFRDSRVTVAGSDGGIDVRASAALAQVKMQGTPVGRPAIQNLVGARGLDPSRRLLFFSNAGYTPTAVGEANRSDVALFTYDMATGTMTAVNGAARQVWGGVARESSRSSSRPKWLPDEAESVGGDVTWFDYPASPMELGDGFEAIWSALGDSNEPNMDDHTVRVNVPPSSGYLGLKAIIAEWEPIIRDDGQVALRVHWCTHSDATPATVEQATADAHMAAARANQILADHVGGWLGHEAEPSGDAPAASPSLPPEADFDWFDYKASPDELSEAFAKVWEVLGGLSVEPIHGPSDDDSFRFTIPANPYIGVKTVVADMEVWDYHGEEAVRIRWSTDSTGIDATEARIEDDAHEAILRANQIVAETLGKPVRRGRE